jgi:anti-repressor protein
MNELQIFQNPEFGEIRTIEENGKVLFCGKDVASALGYKRPADAITAHCKGSVICRLPTNGGEQAVKFIPEGDIYRLAAKSELPGAERFESWIFDEVIPSIRKTGGYQIPQGKELLALAVLEAQKTIEAQATQIEEMRPHALLGRAITTADTSILIGDFAKILRQNGVLMGAKRLFVWMRENGYLIKRKGTDWNLPTQRSMEMGLFEIKESVHIDGNGCNRITRTPKLTGKGQEYFVEKFLHQKAG